MLHLKCQHTLLAVHQLYIICTCRMHIHSSSQKNYIYDILGYQPALICCTNHWVALTLLQKKSVWLGRRYVICICDVLAAYRVLLVGPGRLCLKHHLLFYSFVPSKWAYNSFKVAYYSWIFPRFFILQVQNRPQNIETNITCLEIVSHNGPQGYSQAWSPLYCLLLYCM